MNRAKGFHQFQNKFIVNANLRGVPRKCKYCGAWANDNAPLAKWTSKSSVNKTVILNEKFGGVPQSQLGILGGET